nr:HNH endonuclease signature motif containing protein [Corynebacterium lactis]
MLEAVAEFESLSKRIAEHFDVLSADDATDAYERLERARKRLALVDAAYVVAMGARLPSMEHRRVAWLAQEFRISRAEARQRVRVVDRLRKAPEPLESVAQDCRMPVLRSKVAEGIIGADAVVKIDKAVRDLPASEHAEISKALDAHVSELVDKVRVDDLGQLPVRLRGMLGLDDPYTDEDRARKRSLKIGPQGPDGMSALTGPVTPRLAAVLRRLQADHARPGGLLEEGAQDVRSPEQRFHDALEAAVHAGFSPGGELKPARGTTTLVTVAHIADVAALVGASPEWTKQFAVPGTGQTVTDTGTRLSLSEVVGDAIAKNSFLQVLGDEGQTLYFGRSRRLGSLAQYLALLGEEGGSSAPGNSTPPAMCDIHHVQSWGAGGGTDLSNLTLVDPGTHRRIDDSRSSEDMWWTLRPDEDNRQLLEEAANVGNPGLGGVRGKDNSLSSNKESIDRVIWIPPKSLDTERRRVANEDPNAFDNPGRWLRRKAKARRERGEAEGEPP